jgi:phosphoglycolate phosphatase-like HAD superfamily hydrolase
VTPEQVLKDISDFVKKHAASERVAVIFDLDSTLFCVSPRTQFILRELASKPDFAGRFAREAEVLKNIEILATDWGIRSALVRTRMTSSLEFVDFVRQYWREHFFSNHHLDKDILYPSALEYVNHLNRLGADILYLTGRATGPMREGTLKALATHGFPLKSEDRLIMKPSDVQADETFKATALKELILKYDHIWFFENEPVIIELVRASVPQVKMVFVDSVHAGRAQPPSDLPVVKADFTFKE